MYCIQCYRYLIVFGAPFDLFLLPRTWQVRTPLRETDTSAKAVGTTEVSNELVRNLEYPKIWKGAPAHLQRTFHNNPFGYECHVCDRLWFLRDLKTGTPRVTAFLAQHFPDENTSTFRLCSACLKNCSKDKMPSMSRTNGYKYPPKPSHLPKLNLLTERLISPRLPYMQIRRLRRAGSYGIIGQVINVPVEVDTMVRCLPRSLDDDYAFNVNLKKHITHKSSYLSGLVKKYDVQRWLWYLCEQPLYKHYNIKVDWSVFKNPLSNLNQDDGSSEDIEAINTSTAAESEVILAQQHTMLWNEEHCLDIAPGQNKRPESLIFDQYAEEL